MKRYNKLITVFMTVLVFLYLICSDIQVVYAKDHQSGDNVVYRQPSTAPELDFTFEPIGGNYKYYVDDSTGIPSGGGYYFFKFGDNDKFGAVTQGQLFAYILNASLGLTVSPEHLSGLISAYYTAISSVESGGLYYGGTKLGYCLNDISGCVYENAPENTDITIPSSEQNNIYNWYNYYITAVNPTTPDYISLQTYNLNTALQSINVSNRYLQSYTSIVGQCSSGLTCGLNYNPSSYGNDFLYPWNGYGGVLNLDISSSSFYAYDQGTYDNFCNDYNLVNNGDTVGYTALINSTSTYALNVKVYDNNTTQYITTGTQYSAQRDASTYTTSNASISSGLIVARQKYIPCTSDSKVLTIYKNSTVFTSVVNKTYAPQTFTSTTYNNYDTNSTQNITTNTSTVNNSQNTNTTIYNDASQSFEDYYSNEENYNIDNSVVINQTTEIIYNYYGNGDNPDPNPDPDPDDDEIWKALLKAIADFFKKIGELIATVLTGIVTILTSILDAIATIVSDFTGITDFLGQIFSWLPSEIITLMTLGLSTALFAAFLTWFKK